jgi:hypothetical protein
MPSNELRKLLPVYKYSIPIAIVGVLAIAASVTLNFAQK